MAELIETGTVVDAPATQVWSGGVLSRAKRSITNSLRGDSIKSRLAKGVLWSVLGAGVSQALAFAASIVAARILGRTGFGELGMIQSTVGMFGVFAGAGLGMTATKHVAEFRGKDPLKAGRLIGMLSAAAFVSAGFIALLAFIVAPCLAGRVMQAPQLASAMRIGCVLLFLNALNGAQLGALGGLEAFRTMAVTSLYKGLLNFPCVVCGVVLWGLSGALWGSVVAAFLGWLINHRALATETRLALVPVSYRAHAEEIPVLWRFSLPAVVTSAMFSPVDWVLNTLLVQQPNGYAELGLFNAARQWQAIILYLPGMLSQASLPLLANLWGEGKSRQYRRLLVANSALLTAVAAGVALPVAILSSHVMKAYGSGFAEGRLALVLTCATSVLMASNVVVGQALWACGATRTAILMAALRAALLVVAFVLLRSQGASGLACAYLLTYVVQTAYLIPYSRWQYKHRFGTSGRP